MSSLTRFAFSSLVCALTLSSGSFAQTSGNASPPVKQTAPSATTSPAPATSTTPAPIAPAQVAPAQVAPAPVAAEPPPASLYIKLAGFSVRELTDAEKKKLGRVGFLVDHVANDSPASRAGLRLEDVITGIDGATMKTSRDVVDRVQGADEGHLLRVSIVRAGKDMLVDVQLPGETKAEREKREEEERKKKEEQEKVERDEADAKRKLDDEREEAEKKAKEEAEKLAEEQKNAAENIEQVSEDNDKFGPLGCCVCSALCPPAAPAFVLAMILVDARPVKEPEVPGRRATGITVVRY
jgi:hypothetical protein